MEETTLQGTKGGLWPTSSKTIRPLVPHSARIYGQQPHGLTHGSFTLLNSCSEGAALVNNLITAFR